MDSSHLRCAKQKVIAWNIGENNFRNEDTWNVDIAEKLLRWRTKNDAVLNHSFALDACKLFVHKLPKRFLSLAWWNWLFTYSWEDKGRFLVGLESHELFWDDLRHFDSEEEIRLAFNHLVWSGVYPSNRECILWVKLFECWLYQRITLLRTHSVMRNNQENILAITKLRRLPLRQVLYLNWEWIFQLSLLRCRGYYIVRTHKRHTFEERNLDNAIPSVSRCHSPHIFFVASNW